MVLQQQQQQQQQLKFSKESFLELDLADLLINIWSYADYLHDFVINTVNIVSSVHTKSEMRTVWIFIS